MHYNCLAKTTRMKRNKARILLQRKFLAFFIKMTVLNFVLLKILTQKSLVFANNPAASWNLCGVMRGKLSKSHPNGFVVH